MVKLKSASELSTTTAVNLYTIIVFLGFGFLLFWLSMDRYQDFVATHNNAASKATEVAANGISEIIKNKQRVVDIFTEDFRTLINRLSVDPDNTDLHEAINYRIKKYLPDFFATNIMNSTGQPIIGDFDGNVGELCLADLRYFLKQGEPSIRVHPNVNVYHYDIIYKFETDGVSKIFFVSFNFSEMERLINAVQPSQHKLYLIHKANQDLIEVTDKGARNNMANRLNYRLSGDEKLRVLSSTPVSGTRWHAIDMYEKNLFSGFRTSLIKEYVIVYLLFSIIALYMRSILLSVDVRRTKAEANLKQSHHQVKELNNKLELLSRTDSLTGLYNRRYFDEMVNDEWNKAQRVEHTLTCILIDVDFFKQFNDHYGHQAGDECLKAISKLMNDVFRRAGDIVARYGGEEFIIVMSNVSAESAENTIKQFQEALNLMAIPHKNSTVSEYVTVSAGLVNISPSRHSTIEDAIEQADKALYMAKAGGRNQIVIRKHNDI